MESSSYVARAFFCLWLIFLTFSSSNAQQQEQFRSLPESEIKPLVSDLVSKGFSICAAVVQPVQSLIPSRSTLLLPTNDAIANVTSNLSQEDILRTLQYHVITYPTSFRALSRKSEGSLLPTLLRGAFLNVTSNSPGNFAINGVNITQPDVCSSTEFVACHGIDQVILFNSSLAFAPVGSPEAAEEPSTVEAPSTVDAPPAGTGARNANTTSNKNAAAAAASVHELASSIGLLLAVWLLLM